MSPAPVMPAGLCHARFAPTSEALNDMPALSRLGLTNRIRPSRAVPYLPSHCLVRTSRTQRYLALPAMSDLTKTNQEQPDRYGPRLPNHVRPQRTVPCLPCRDWWCRTANRRAATRPSPSCLTIPLHVYRAQRTWPYLPRSAPPYLVPTEPAWTCLPSLAEPRAPYLDLPSLPNRAGSSLPGPAKPAEPGREIPRMPCRTPPCLPRVAQPWCNAPSLGCLAEPNLVTPSDVLPRAACLTAPCRPRGASPA